ncbi:sodium/proton antiporter, CPA1 family [Raineyella antarctica]|uniref:Sodium/proton antiporter, CPA1 family n=1 Tax=Raineyella antarctica TaxID=1577474 RepID=A0A1G6HMB2_9ACTN|nr:Na+/H+ antiporter [Raineyella antarctica]SDB95382.1 sodium/proton antiporter, CPA1 family [Raineyella antarctica]
MEMVITIGLVALVVVATSVVADRLHASAPLLLMLVGLVGSVLPFVRVPALSPELVLVGLLPPLLYATAVNTSLVDFRQNLPSIGLLSVGLVLFTVAGVGLVVRLVLDVPWAAAFALGAVVAPPDAVAASAVARRVGLPRRIVTVLEGESLVNDATALTSLRSATIALTVSLSAVSVGLDFLWAVLAAVAVGLVVARLAGLAFRHLDEAPVTTALSFIVPFAAYVPTELVHGSGVLAVVVAGLALGHRSPRDQGAEERLAQRINWSTVQFLLENAVFLLIGLQATSIVRAAADSGHDARVVVLSCVSALAAVIVLRMVWVLATRAILRGRTAFTLRESLVVGWAGMRGVVTLAAALALPATTPGRPVLVLAALVVTVGTLLLQGATLPLLARRLGLRGPDPREDAISTAVVLQKAAGAGIAAVEQLAGPEDRAVVDELRAEARRRVNGVWERLGRPSSEHGASPQRTRHDLRLAGLAAEREELLRIRDEARVDQSVVSSILNGIDLEESLAGYLNGEDLATSEVPFHAQLPDEPCEHLRSAPQVVAPSSLTGCPDCLRAGLTWVHLRMCLDCGNIGCCDSSPGRHAAAHFRATGHPVMRSFEPGESWRWCFVDEILGTEPTEETPTSLG